MIGIQAAPKRRLGKEVEKPFWISYSDLMTSLMVLFLVVMMTALLSVTAGVQRSQAGEQRRNVLIRSCMAEVEQYTRSIAGVRVSGYSVDFGSLAHFQNNSSILSEEQERFLRRFVPRVLTVARTPDCAAFLKHVVVEGFASQSGSYLHNLELSTRRSEAVLCALLRPSAEYALSRDDRELIQDLFLIGGYSFNSSKHNEDDSRRIELRLEFYALKDQQEPLQTHLKTLQTASLSDDTSCPVGSK